ncbi:MAG TPA: hypothetical protein PKD00_05065 [Burkholderiales bacterium]|nr:hypothetical protein [Burkholderiales bacterium]
MSSFDELEDEIKNRLNKEIYNNLTGNFVINNESKKYIKLLKNLKIIVTHKNTDGISNNSNTKTSWFANSSNKYNIRTDTHEKIIQAINKDRGYAKLPVIKGLIDKISDEDYGYSGKTSYFQPFFRKAYLDKDGFGILKLSSEFNCAIIKAKWSNGIPISGQIKLHTDNDPLKNAIEFIRNKNGSYTFIRKVENSDKTIIEYKFTTKTFKEKLHVITGTRESLNKLSIVKTLDNKQIVLEKTFPRMDTIEFLKECNNGLISSELTTLTLKNPSRSYDENFKASLALAVVYHLIKVSKVLDDSIANNNKIDLDKLKFYINLFMDLTKNAVAKIIKYAKTMHIGEIENPITIDTKEYKLFLNIDINNTPAINLKELSEILVKNKNTQALRYGNENQKTIYKQIINQLSIKNANEDKTVKEEFICLIKEMDEPIVKLKPFGLKNFKNDCFIISAIQFILNNEILLNAILDHPDEEIKENFTKMLSTKGKDEKISKLLMERIRKIANIEKGVQDATEVVLRTLFGSYDKLIGYKTIKNQEDLKIKNIFEYLNDNKNHINLLKEVIKNIYSNYLTEEHKALKDFLLNEFKDEQFIQLKELFGNKKFIEFKDIIDNKDFLILLQKLIHHEEFQQKMNKERKMFLWFDVSNYGAKQKGDKINLGMPLKWSEIPHNENVNAIVIHEGKTVNSGHYFTYIKKDDKWYECNDNKVRIISDITEETQNKRIAIFSYEYKKYITTENDNFRYEGEINEKGEMHGRGKIFWKDTQHTYIGDFANDCPCRSGLLYKYNSTFSVIFEKIGDKESKVTKEEEIKIYNNLSGI